MPGNKKDKVISPERAARQAARKGMFKAAVTEVQGIASTSVRQGEGFVQHVYDDYETYRRVQEQGNKTKLMAQFVKKTHIFFLADWLTEQGCKPGFALCHGVRRGREQAWFRRRMKGADVIGTDISETASQFENTVQWDFHDDNPDWQGRADFVYSNSWDHAYDPAKAFRAWMACLRPGGWLLIDHTKGHSPKSTNVLDPFGATLDATQRILAEAGAGIGVLGPVLDRSTDPDYPAHVLTFQRAPG